MYGFLEQEYTVPVPVPLWNVARFMFISVGVTSLLSKLWSSIGASAAGCVVARGGEVQLRSRTFTRSSLVAEEDAKNWKVRWLINAVAMLLFVSDLALEFGSGAKEVLAGPRLGAGYQQAHALPQLEVIHTSLGHWDIASQAGELYFQDFKVTEMSRYSFTDGTKPSVDDLADLRKRDVLDSSWQRIDSINKGAWLAVRQLAHVSFAGAPGKMLVRNRTAIYSGYMGEYVLEIIGQGNIDSSIFAEAMSETRLAVAFTTLTRTNSPLRISLPARPQFEVNCGGDGTSIPGWKVVCRPFTSRPWQMLRPEVAATRDRRWQVESELVDVYFGAPSDRGDVQSDADGLEYSPRTSDGASRVVSTRRGSILLTLGRWQMKLSVSPKGLVTCLRPLHFRTDAESYACRVRLWQEETEQQGAMMALQLAMYRDSEAWAIYDMWKASPATVSTVRLEWIRGGLTSRAARQVSNTRTVATVRAPFLLGIMIILGTTLLGILVLISNMRVVGRGPALLRNLTIERTRRSLAMSQSTRFNCCHVPCHSPVTSIVATGDLTCHLTTTYRERVKTERVIAPERGYMLLMGTGGFKGAKQDEVKSDDCT
ncbi:unnamed protein product [Chondrus crispus]|uniref:Uncharacterized protein n=1 Tax=Chondrus crispus TaxID=2769 RepID=R7Q5Q9_CHOCR|nr:unnamed protein product [Chondrus crispus]CDF33173.1 unnamed protein product [Chondrus crispus]|eukprot:XP_005712976.1 unnamed protein product [Chondrus crispus]